MTTTLKRMTNGAQLTTSAATYYTAGTGVRCMIKHVTFCNTSGSNVTVTAYLVPSGGSATDSNIITKTHTLIPSETWNCPDLEGHVIEDGGTLQALASANTSVNIVASGVETTN